MDEPRLWSEKKGDRVRHSSLERDHPFLAEQFLALVHAPLIRYVIAGKTEVTADLFARARQSVDFFLCGCGKPPT